MTRTELIENLCDHFHLDMPEKKENGKYDLGSYAWSAGCYTGAHDENGESIWLSLSSVVDALWYACDADDDYE